MSLLEQVLKAREEAEQKPPCQKHMDEVIAREKQMARMRELLTKA